MPNEIVASFEQAFEIDPEPLIKRVDSFCAAGEFTGTTEAAALSRSALFTRVPVPVVARFSGTRDDRNVRELELEFGLRGGGVHHMAMLNTPVFGTADPVTFEEMLVAVKPDPYTGKPDPLRLREFLAAHPDAFTQRNLLTAFGSPSNYAATAYFSIHTFRFIDSDGRTHFVRWRFEPKDNRDGTMSRLEPAETTEDSVEERLITRLARSPVRWDMIVSLGEPEDTTDNASIAWPEDRMHLEAGTLTITRAMPGSAPECGERRFDPLIVADGIAPTDDPVLLFRSPTYRLAFSENLAQALTSPNTAIVRTGVAWPLVQ